MGAEQSNLSQEEFFKSFQSRYNFIKETTDLRFGEIHIYKENTSSNYVFVKGLMCESEESYHQLLKESSRRQQMSHRNLIKMIGYSQQSEAQVCGISSIITTYYEFFQLSLEKEIANRLQSSKNFSEVEIWFLLESIISVLAYLENQKIYHGDVRPINILMASDGQIKIADQLFINSNKNGYVKALQGEQVYFSPQSIAAFARRETNPQFNPYKNDVYTTAISVLEACTFASANDLFDISSGQVNQHLLQQLLAHARQRYSQFLCNLLTEMLSEDENQRPSFTELSKLLQPYEHLIRNMEPFIVETQSQVQYIPQSNPIAQSIIINPSQQPTQQIIQSQYSQQTSPKLNNQQKLASIPNFQNIPQSPSRLIQYQPEIQQPQIVYQVPQYSQDFIPQSHLQSQPYIPQTQIPQSHRQFQSYNSQQSFQQLPSTSYIPAQQQQVPQYSFNPQSQGYVVQSHQYPPQNYQTIIQQPPQQGYQQVIQQQFQSPIRNDYSKSLQTTSFDPYVRPIQFSPHNFNQYPQNAQVYSTSDIDRRVQEALKTSEETILRHSTQQQPNGQRIQYRQY